MKADRRLLPPSCPALDDNPATPDVAQSLVHWKEGEEERGQPHPSLAGRYLHILPDCDRDLRVKVGHLCCCKKIPFCPLFFFPPFSSSPSPNPTAGIVRNTTALLLWDVEVRPTYFFPCSRKDRLLVQPWRLYLVNNGGRLWKKRPGESLAVDTSRACWVRWQQ